MIRKHLYAIPLIFVAILPANAQLGAIPLASQAVQPPGATAARPLGQKLSDQLAIQDFGAVCDGTTDDSAAVVAAGQSGRRIIVPNGVTCNAPSVAQATMQGVFIGGGQIRGSDGNPRAPQTAAVRVAPNPAAWNQATSQQDNCSAGFPCWGRFDYSHTLSAEEYHISGAATLGQPVHNYEGMPGVNAHTMLIDNSSGWNQSHNSNDGRTGASAYAVVLQNNGAGDFGVYGAQLLCNGQVGPGDGNTTAGPNGIINGYTDWLAVPNCGFEGGNLTAISPGQYLQVGEFHVNDNGNDVSAIGQVVGYNRTATTAKINNRWVNELATCNLARAAGAIPCDAAYQVGGQWHLGLSFVGDSTIQAIDATVAQMAGQKITLNGTLNDPTGEGNPRLTTVGGDWITDDGTGVVLAQNGGTVVRLSNPAGAVDGWQLSGAATGGYVTMAPTGTDASIAAVFGDKAGAGVAFLSNGNVVLNLTNPVSSPTAYFHMQPGTSAAPPVLAVYSLNPADLGLSAAGTGLVRLTGSTPAAGDSSNAVATTALATGAARTAVTAMIANRYKIANVGSGAVIALPVPASVLDQMIVEIEPNAATIANMTLTMPATAAIPDGFIVHFIATGTITSFTNAGATGQTVLGAPGTISPATPVAFMWDSALTQWIPFR